MQLLTAMWRYARKQQALKQARAVPTFAEEPTRFAEFMQAFRGIYGDERGVRDFFERHFHLIDDHLLVAFLRMFLTGPDPDYNGAIALLQPDPNRQGKYTDLVDDLQTARDILRGVVAQGAGAGAPGAPGVAAGPPGPPGAAPRAPPPPSRSFREILPPPGFVPPAAADESLHIAARFGAQSQPGCGGDVVCATETDEQLQRRIQRVRDELPQRIVHSCWGENIETCRLFVLGVEGGMLKHYTDPSLEGAIPGARPPPGFLYLLGWSSNPFEFRAHPTQDDVHVLQESALERMRASTTTERQRVDTDRDRARRIEETRERAELQRATAAERRREFDVAERHRELEHEIKEEKYEKTKQAERAYTARWADWLDIIASVGGQGPLVQRAAAAAPPAAPAVNVERAEQEERELIAAEMHRHATAFAEYHERMLAEILADQQARALEARADIARHQTFAETAAGCTLERADVENMIRVLQEIHTRTIADVGRADPFAWTNAWGVSIPFCACRTPAAPPQDLAGNLQLALQRPDVSARQLLTDVEEIARNVCLPWTVKQTERAIAYFARSDHATIWAATQRSAALLADIFGNPTKGENVRPWYLRRGSEKKRARGPCSEILARAGSGVRSWGEIEPTEETPGAGGAYWRKVVTRWEEGRAEHAPSQRRISASEFILSDNHAIFDHFVNLVTQVQKHTSDSSAATRTQSAQLAKIELDWFATHTVWSARAGVTYREFVLKPRFF